LDLSAFFKEGSCKTPDEKDPSITWNFTKFLIDRRGSVVARFEPTASFESIAMEIEKLM
jgi:glutathione peroxidase